MVDRFCCDSSANRASTSVCDTVVLARIERSEIWDGAERRGPILDFAALDGADDGADRAATHGGAISGGDLILSARLSRRGDAPPVYGGKARSGAAGGGARANTADNMKPREMHSAGGTD